MLKVVYIVTTVDGYGADKSILNNILYLKQHRMVDPFVIIPKSGLIEEQFLKNGLPYEICDHRSWFAGHKWFINRRVKRSLKSFYNRFMANILAMRLRKIGPFDLVHTNTMTTNFGIHLSKYINAKHIMHIRELPVEHFGWCYEYGERPTLLFIGRHSSAVIANSDYVADKFGHYLGSIRTLHNGIFEKKLMKNPCKYDYRNGLRIIIAGRLSEGKGQMTAIMAMKYLREMGGLCSDVCLDIYGDGELGDVYADYIKKYDLTETINMIPFDSNLYKQMKNYHIGLICSRCEAFGRTAIEYMGNGLAVIGNNSGNTPYIVRDGENGLIAKFSDPADLAKKIGLLVSDKTLIAKYGRKGFESVLCGFSIESSSRELLSIYESVT